MNSLDTRFHRVSSSVHKSVASGSIATTRCVYCRLSEFNVSACCAFSR